MGYNPGDESAEQRIDNLFAVWLVMMALNILLQLQAMRWMLKTQWRDFRLKAVTTPE